MISKELLSEVLEIKVFAEIREDDDVRNNILVYWEFDGYRNECRNINIYELAFKCKKWAISNGFDVLSGGLEQGKYSCYLDSELELTHNEYKIDKYNISCETLSFYEDTEIKAIFKACQWILKNKEQK